MASLRRRSDVGKVSVIVIVEGNKEVIVDYCVWILLSRAAVVLVFVAWLIGLFVKL